MKRTSLTQRVLFVFISALFVLSIVITAIQGYYYYLHRYETTESAKFKARDIARDTTQELNRQLKKLSMATQKIARDLSSGKIHYYQVPTKLKSTMRENPNLYGMGVAYMPYPDATEFPRTAPFYVNRDSLPEPPPEKYVQLFSSPIRYRDPQTGGETVTGVVFADYLLEGLQEMVASLKLEKSGYAFLLARNGAILAHPLKEWVGKDKTIFQKAEIQGRKELKLLGEQVMDGEKGALRYVSKHTGQPSWLFYSPVPVTDWTLVVAYFDEINTEIYEESRQRLIRLSLYLLVALISGAVLVYRLTRTHLYAHYLLTAAISLLLMAEIGFTWYLAMGFISGHSQDTVQILDRESLDDYSQRHAREMRSLNRKPPIFISTGIMIQSMDFPSAAEVTLTGYTWQRFSKALEGKIEPGIIFSDAVSQDFKLIYDEPSEENRPRRLCWHFSARLKGNYDYSRYPFETKTVKINLWSRDFANNVVLAPDISAYPVMAPSRMPGLKRALDVPGWKIYSSFFLYPRLFGGGRQEHAYNWRENAPALTFCMTMKRRFSGPFISRIVPLLAMLMILFIMVTVQQKKQISLLTSALGVCAAFIFTVIISQANLRSSLSQHGIVYFEYFYIIMYIVIFLCIVNIVLYIRTEMVPLVQYRHNLAAKLVFWPLTLLMLLGVTIFTFY